MFVVVRLSKSFNYFGRTHAITFNRIVILSWSVLWRIFESDHFFQTPLGYFSGRECDYHNNVTSKSDFDEHTSNRPEGFRGSTPRDSNNCNGILNSAIAESKNIISSILFAYTRKHLKKKKRPNL